MNLTYFLLIIIQLITIKCDDIAHATLTSCTDNRDCKYDEKGRTVCIKEDGRCHRPKSLLERCLFKEECTGKNQTCVSGLCSCREGFSVINGYCVDIIICNGDGDCPNEMECCELRCQPKGTRREQKRQIIIWSSVAWTIIVVVVTGIFIVRIIRRRKERKVQQSQVMWT